LIERRKKKTSFMRKGGARGRERNRTNFSGKFEMEKKKAILIGGGEMKTEVSAVCRDGICHEC